MKSAAYHEIMIYAHSCSPSLSKERGAYKIYALATHGLLSNARLIEESHIDEVVVTNSVPHDLQKMQCHKIKVDLNKLRTTTNQNENPPSTSKS